MNTDPAIASGYRSHSPSNAQILSRPVVNFPRERAYVPTSTTVWPNLPERCFGADRHLPEWLIRPWLLLQDAAQRRRPLSERLTDLNQVAQSLDDLFAVHLPAEAGWFQSKEAAGLSISEHIPRWVDELIGEATSLFMHQLRPELLTKGIYVRSVAQLDEWQRDWLHQHFMQRIYPLLTPLAVDPGRPFPYISSHSLNLLVELHRVEGVRSGNLVDRNSLFARVKIPRSTPRLVAVPTHPSSTFSPTIYVCSADLVRYYVRHLFTGMPVRHVYLFRVVRGDQPLPGVCASAATRPRRQEDKPVVRLDVEQRMGAPVLNWLMEHLRLPRYALAQHDRLFDWSCLPDLAAWEELLQEGEPAE
jgi:polyphosphate kinase